METPRSHWQGLQLGVRGLQLGVRSSPPHGSITPESAGSIGRRRLVCCGASCAARAVLWRAQRRPQRGRGRTWCIQPPQDLSNIVPILPLMHQRLRGRGPERARRLWRWLQGCRRRSVGREPHRGRQHATRGRMRFEAGCLPREVRTTVRASRGGGPQQQTCTFPFAVSSCWGRGLEGKKTWKIKRILDNSSNDLIGALTKEGDMRDARAGPLVDVGASAARWPRPTHTHARARARAERRARGLEFSEL